MITEQMGYQGCMMGLAAGDALGTTVEFKAPGRFKYKEPPEIKGTGYVVKSLEAALWAFCHSTSFKDGCFLAVNLGDDADTTGAVYGQLAGAFYGVNDIRDDWLKKIVYRKLIESLAGKLFDLSGRIQPS